MTSLLGWLEGSAPAEISLILDAPTGQGEQGLRITGTAGAADLTLSATLGAGFARALQGSMGLELELKSTDPTALTAQLDLRKAEDVETLRRLVKQADVFSQSYRPGALAARGFAPQELAKLRPGIVYVSLSAWGMTGPWKDRRGFDSIVQCVSGMADVQGAGGAPKLLPCSAIDYVSGYLMAFGAMVALARRAKEGGSWLVRVGLARTGKWIVYTSADSVFQIAAHEETIPLDELYAGCRVAREILTGKHAVGRVIARPFVGEPGHYERTPNRHDFSLEPRRPNYLTAVREAGNTTYGVGKISDIFAGCDIDESFPTKSNVDGINRTIELLENIDSGLVFVNLVETDQLWGHRNDPVNFHRCLQDFDRRLPDILDALRDGDLLILTSDHGCDPTTPSTDHSREHALLLAYAAGKNAAGRIHEDGEFGDVGATVCAWLGAKHPGKGAPGRPIVEK